VKSVWNGIKWAAGGVRDGIGRATGGAWGKLSEAIGRPREGASRPVEPARRRTGYTIAIAAGVLFALAWIGWAIYVTSENGARAGLGVLLSWPVLLGALALIAAPFVLTAMLVQRRREPSPVIAGAPGVTEQPEAKAPAEDESGSETEAEADAEEENQGETVAEEDSAAKSA
jgi:hypothetical protein